VKTPIDLDPKRLLVLHALAETGGIATATRRLSLTHSAVSHALARLEQLAGVPLLEHSAGRIALTAAGRALAVRGARITEQLEGGARDLAKSGARVSTTAAPSASVS
jgi:molybdate transport repressor ModE-like protein